MNDMEVGDVVKEEAALPSEERPVDSGGSTALEIPLLATVVGENGVGVMEISNHDDYKGNLINFLKQIRRR